MLGIKKANIFIEDLREEFVRDYVFPMFRANALYEGVYLLGTSIARPLIAKKQIDIARKTGADAVCHGATGKGNDQVRFELSYYALEPAIKIIAPWREWDFKSREDLIDFAEQHQIPVAKDKRGRGAVLGRRQPAALLLRGQGAGGPGHRAAATYVYQRTISPDGGARQGDRHHRSASRRAMPSASTARRCRPATLLATLNDLGRDNGIGRIDLVENRFVGMKSRGVYETPGGTILLAAHRAIESITLDRGAAHLKDELMPRYAELIYNGFWFSPEREMLQALIDKSQEHVEGEVRLKLYKGNVIVTGRESAEVALFAQRSSPSRTTRAPTTRRTPRASSSSTRCACARLLRATRVPQASETWIRLGRFAGGLTVPCPGNGHFPRMILSQACACGRATRRYLLYFLSRFLCVYPAEHARART